MHRSSTGGSCGSRRGRRSTTTGRPAAGRSRPTSCPSTRPRRRQGGVRRRPPGGRGEPAAEAARCRRPPARARSELRRRRRGDGDLGGGGAGERVPGREEAEGADDMKSTPMSMKELKALAGREADRLAEAGRRGSRRDCRRRGPPRRRPRRRSRARSGSCSSRSRRAASPTWPSRTRSGTSCSARLSRQLSPRILEHPAATDEVRRQLDEYFAGDRTRFELKLDRRLMRGIARDVLAATARVPFGRTTTYGALAERIGRPRASRAVGNALGSNPIPIVVPCHRVLRAGGDVGGYAGGPSRKRRLLTLEGSLPARAMLAALDGRWGEHRVSGVSSHGEGSGRDRCGPTARRARRSGCSRRVSGWRRC